MTRRDVCALSHGLSLGFFYNASRCLRSVSVILWFITEASLYFDAFSLSHVLSLGLLLCRITMPPLFLKVVLVYH